MTVHYPKFYIHLNRQVHVLNHSLPFCLIKFWFTNYTPVFSIMLAPLLTFLHPLYSTKFPFFRSCHHRLNVQISSWLSCKSLGTNCTRIPIVIIFLLLFLSNVRQFSFLLSPISSIHLSQAFSKINSWVFLVHPHIKKRSLDKENLANCRPIYLIIISLIYLNSLKNCQNSSHRSII